MDEDPQTTTSCKGQPEEERQNRRQFFNGLGKWSLAIIAAVTALREGSHDALTAIGSRFETGSDGASDSRQQFAKKKTPTPYKEFKHDERPPYTDWREHGDAARTQPRGGQPSGQLPTKVQE